MLCGVLHTSFLSLSPPACCAAVEKIRPLSTRLVCLHGGSGKVLRSSSGATRDSGGKIWEKLTLHTSSTLFQTHSPINYSHFVFCFVKHFNPGIVLWKQLLRWLSLGPLPELVNSHRGFLIDSAPSDEKTSWPAFCSNPVFFNWAFEVHLIVHPVCVLVDHIMSGVLYKRFTADHIVNQSVNTPVLMCHIHYERKLFLIPGWWRPLISAFSRAALCLIKAVLFTLCV